MAIRDHRNVNIPVSVIVEQNDPGKTLNVPPSFQNKSTHKISSHPIFEESILLAEHKPFYFSTSMIARDYCSVFYEQGLCESVFAISLGKMGKKKTRTSCIAAGRLSPKSHMRQQRLFRETFQHQRTNMRIKLTLSLKGQLAIPQSISPSVVIHNN